MDLPQGTVVGTGIVIGVGIDTQEPQGDLEWLKSTDIASLFFGVSVPIADRPCNGI